MPAVFDDSAQYKRYCHGASPRCGQSTGRRIAKKAGSNPRRQCLGVARVLQRGEMDVRFGGSPPAVAQAIDRYFRPLVSLALTACSQSMTTKRHEIIIEGSYDGVEGREYEFRYKPGNVTREPRWNIPHQPRLDWQMWFAALQDPGRLLWFLRFLQRLLQNEPAVTALLERSLSRQTSGLCACAVLRLHHRRQQRKGRGRMVGAEVARGWCRPAA